MRSSVISQVRLSFAVAMLLGLSGCESEPVVVLGRAPTMKPPDAGMDTAAGSGGSSDDSHECTEDEPVCGTDGMTYRNGCQALAAGVGVARFGPC